MNLLGILICVVLAFLYVAAWELLSEETAMWLSLSGFLFGFIVLKVLVIVSLFR